MLNFIHISTLGPATALFACLSSTIWTASVVLIVRSPIFRRKWLWGLLTTSGVGFSFCLTDLSTEMIRVGIPLGALYVIWFWRSARSAAPSPPQNV